MPTLPLGSGARHDSLAPLPHPVFASPPAQPRGRSHCAVRPRQPAHAQHREILNVSYDTARELYAALNPVVADQWPAEHDETLAIQQSHAGSSKQARAFLKGLKADLVTFNQVLDVRILADKCFVDAGWQQALSKNASPCYSLPALLVRGGNPKGVEDWDDLTRDEVSSIFPNPKTSGDARCTCLAAYACALDKFEGDDAAAQEVVRKVLITVEDVFGSRAEADETHFGDGGALDRPLRNRHRARA
ncbi:sulfate ABC transporter substrate-binding protein [uncultured Salipiger sp.]|uniref:sulfate ABC transporter substrate-binding protein n=1 Tax=uncultured Salipiger sp. TaxID=499810 RepID=UPI0025916520|nr:sulfate ABC transporter substrate-binding protein [uncultured Salipiger sp.]